MRKTTLMPAQVRKYTNIFVPYNAADKLTNLCMIFNVRPRDKIVTDFTETVTKSL